MVLANSIMFWWSSGTRHTDLISVFTSPIDRRLHKKTLEMASKIGLWRNWWVGGTEPKMKGKMWATKKKRRTMWPTIFTSILWALCGSTASNTNSQSPSDYYCFYYCWRWLGGVCGWSRRRWPAPNISPNFSSHTRNRKIMAAEKLRLIRGWNRRPSWLRLTLTPFISLSTYRLTMSSPPQRISTRSL